MLIQMTTNELQSLVMLEALTLGLITLLIVAAVRRWKIILCATSALATIAVFSTWTAIMALASAMVYIPASILLWFELDSQENLANLPNIKVLRLISWSLLAVGIVMLILKNIYNIYGYLQ